MNVEAVFKAVLFCCLFLVSLVVTRQQMVKINTIHYPQAPSQAMCCADQTFLTTTTADAVHVNVSKTHLQMTPLPKSTPTVWSNAQISQNLSFALVKVQLKAFCDHGSDWIPCSVRGKSGFYLRKGFPARQIFIIVRRILLRLSSFTIRMGPRNASPA